MKVTPARPDDVVAVAGLLEEMNRFYGMAGGGQLEERVREISEALFTDPPAAYALVAWDQAQLVPAQHPSKVFYRVEAAGEGFQSLREA